MCMPMDCPLCHKTTWKGCGKHIDSVMANVPKEKQCTCPRKDVEAAMAAK